VGWLKPSRKSSQSTRAAAGRIGGRGAGAVGAKTVPALSTLHSGLNQLCQTVEQNRIATEFELRRQTDEIVTELRDLKLDRRERRDLIDAIEKIAADGTRVLDDLKWIGSKVDDMANHAFEISRNTERRLPSFDP
jgi:hypothetical protein